MSASTTHLIVGAGPVGRLVAAEHLERGNTVRMATRSVPADLDPRIEHHRIDATDAAALADAAEGVSTIVNGANPPYDQWPTMWPPIMAGITAAATKTGATLVQPDNLYMYGPGSGIMREDTPHRAIGAKGKLRSTMISDLLDAHDRGDLATVVVRASDFYGPWVTDSGFGSFVFPRVLANKKPQMMGRPTARHSFTYVPDLARALVDAGADPTAWGRVWHAPVAPAPTLAEAAAEAQRTAGVAAKPAMYMRMGILRIAGLFQPLMREMQETLYQWSDDFLVDDSAFREHFGWEATPFETGVAATVEWYRSHPAN